MKYSEKLKDPRWQKKRLEIFERDNWTCRGCCDTESTLAVHHLYYTYGKEPWEYEDVSLITLCQECHETETTRSKQIDEVLNYALKANGFFVNDRWLLSKSFASMYMPYPAEVMASVLSYALNNKEIMNFLCDSYFESIKLKV